MFNKKKSKNSNYIHFARQELFLVLGYFTFTLRNAGLIYLLVWFNTSEDKEK